MYWPTSIFNSQLLGTDRLNRTPEDSLWLTLLPIATPSAGSSKDKRLKENPAS